MKKFLSRRTLLKAGSAAAGITLLLPKHARGTPPTGSVKRVILINCGGGVRWTCSFDGQPDLGTNPWGVANWAALGTTTPQPEWGFGRMLMQKPLATDTADWNGAVLPYLTSDSHYNLNRPSLPMWSGQTLPTFADISNEVAVVRCNNSPRGDVNLDHAAAGTALAYGSTSGGAAGMVTAMYDALKRQYGAATDTYYPMPSAAVGAAGFFGGGYGAYAGSRPILFSNPSNLPTRDPTANVSKWGRRSELRLDPQFARGVTPFISDKIANLMNDKVSGDAHGRQLIDPILRIDGNPGGTLGNIVGTTTPVSNAMLGELFGISNAVAPAGDLLFDSFAASNLTSWVDSYGYNSAFAIRLLQMGAPVVAFADEGSNFDSHGGEVTGFDNRGGHARQLTRAVRALTALELGLKKIADPMDPTASLWDSTVVFICSEFGRPGGFNVGNGSTNGGGSDHGPWSAWPIMGGPVVQGGAGGKLIKDTANGGFFHQNQFFTTLMAAMGVQDANSTYLQYSDFPPITGIFRGV